MKKILFLTVLVPALLFQNGRAHGITAKKIIENSQKKIRGNTVISLYEITIKTKRWKRTLKMRSWENRILKKSFSEIIAPKKDKGNRFLLINKNMRHFVPKLQRVIKISPSMMLQAWMGSDFTNDDIVKESSIINDYAHTFLGRETVRGHDSFKIELKPKPEAAVVWGKIIFYVRAKDYLPLKEEFYNEHNVLKKILTFSNFKRMHNRIIPTKYKMETVRKKGRYTVMKIKKARFNTGIPGRIFSLQNLKRR